MLEFKPNAARIVEMLTDESLIDEIVKGTEHAHLIDKEAKGQRGGVLATLSEIGESLRLLPSLDDCSSKLSLTNWCYQRRGWIFITSTQDTRDALRNLQAAWINILMKRLLAAPPSWARQRPCWIVVDEVHSLKRLPPWQPHRLKDGSTDSSLSWEPRIKRSLKNTTDVAQRLCYLHRT